MEHIVKAFDKELSLLKNCNLEMMLAVSKQLDLLHQSLSTEDKSIIEDIILGDDKVNQLDAKIVDLSINIFSRRNPVAYDLRFVFASSHISRNLERMGDYIRSVAKNYKYVENQNDKAQSLTLQSIHSLSQMLFALYNCFKDNSVKSLEEIKSRDTNINDLYKTLLKFLLEKATASGEKDISYINNYILMAKSLERVGDHMVNICKYINFIENGTLD